MTPERWRRLTELFEAALDREAADRTAFLASACADDPELRRELEMVLDSHERAAGFGDTPAFVVTEHRRDSTLEAGVRLGRYEIVALLGAGGMGEVYRARDPQLGREVGIKILPRRGGVTSDQLARFEREARAVAALSHPNILAVHDIGIEAGAPYVVSELLEGETLRARLQDGPLPLDQALEYARHVVSGLTAAHDKGIIHRDIKPENLFITSGRVVKILDFGLAKQVGTALETAVAGITAHADHSVTMGTAGYMSPEQMRGQQADARSDVFAMGAVLYEIVTGRRAFVGETPEEKMSAVLTAQPPDVAAICPEIPPAFARAVHRCLEKDAHRRFTSMRELGLALEGAVPAPARQMPPGVEPRVILAVLPFENLSDGDEQEYFSDGLTEEMIAQLGRLNPSRLGVIARTSAMRYKRTQKGVDVIGRELGAAYVLEGSVRRSGDRVRVTAQLVQAGDQTHVWTETYDRSLGDVLALQADLAHAIAGEIRVQLAPAEQVRLERRRAIHPAAYDAYLKGRYFWNRRTRDTLEQSVDCFKTAIAIDPGYAAAHAGLADAYLTQQDYNYLPPREAFALANAAALEALRLDDTLAEPHTSLGHLRLHQFAWDEAEARFRRAIELNPGYTTAHYYYGNLLAALGRFDEAHAEARRTLEIDPASANTRQNRVFLLYLARRYDEALAFARETLELDPTYTGLHYSVGLIYERQRRFADALASFERVSPAGHSRGATVLAATGYTQAMAGDRAAALAIVEQLDAISGREYVSWYDLALIHLALGDRDRACDLLAKAYDDCSSFLPFLNIDARLEAIRTDPRIQALLRRMELPATPATADTPSRQPAVGRRAPLVAAVLVLIGVAAAGVFVGSRPQPPALGASGRPAVAVLPFADHTADPGLAWLSDGLPSMLITSLAQTPGLDVFGEDRRDASGTLLAGSLFKNGSDIRVDLQLQDVATGRVLAATSEAGSDVFAIVDALAGRIRTTLQVEDRPPGRPLRDVTTESLDAYELYVKGLNAFRNVRRGDARTLLAEALRVDPAFAMARVQLALVLERLGEPVEAATHRRIVELDRLPERQRLLVEAKREFDVAPLRARAIAERLLERYPDEEEAYDLIIHTLTYTRDPMHWKEALAFMQRWDRAIPGPGSGHFHNHYGYILIDNGLFAEAEKEFRAYIRVSPDEANPYDSLAELFLITSRPAEAIEHYDQALRRNPVFGISYWGRAYAQAMLGRYRDALASVSTLNELGPRSGISAAAIHTENAFIRARAGRYREADMHLAAARRAARERGDAAAEVDSLLLASTLALERDDRPRIVATLRDADRITAGMPADIMRERRTAFAHLIRGSMEARSGRSAAARAAHAAQQAIGHDNDDVQHAWKKLLAAEIALSEGALAQADAAFKAGEYRVPPSFSIYPVLIVLNNNHPFRDGPARVSAARGDLRQAIDLYRRLNEPDIASPWADVVDPRLVLAAARLAAGMSDHVTATAEYTRFLNLWQDADADLPELTEARRYLSRR